MGVENGQESASPSLRDEILHTDDSEYRDFLKERERFVKEFVHNLKTQTGAAGQS